MPVAVRGRVCWDPWTGIVWQGTPFPQHVLLGIAPEESSNDQHQCISVKTPRQTDSYLLLLKTDEGHFELSRICDMKVSRD